MADRISIEFAGIRDTKFVDLPDGRTQLIEDGHVIGIEQEWSAELGKFIDKVRRPF